MTNELYTKLVCALTHDLDICERCGKCGKGVDARINLINELAKQENFDSIFTKDDYKDSTPLFTYTDYFYGGSPEEMKKKYNFKSVDDSIAKINSLDRYKLPDDYDTTISRINDWSGYTYNTTKIDSSPCVVKLNPDRTPDLTGCIDSGPYMTRLDENGNPVICTVTANKGTK